MHAWTRTQAFTNTHSFAHRWPPGVRIPPLPKNIDKGESSNVRKPRPTATLGMSATQTMYFAQHSILLLGGLLPQEAKRLPAWRSWLLHHRVLMMCLQRTFNTDELELLDDLITQYSTQFQKVPEYGTYYKPKHHFLHHVVIDIVRFGPPRFFWCLPSEAFQKIIKAAANRSNYKDECMTVLDFWSMKSAMALKEGPSDSMWYGELREQDASITEDVHE